MTPCDLHYADGELVAGIPAGARGFIPVAIEGEFIAGYWVVRGDGEALLPGKRPRTPALEQHLALLQQLFPSADSVKEPPAT